MNLIEKNLVVNFDSKNDPKKKRVLVLGLGSTGISMVRWFMLKNAEIFVMDSRHRPPFQNLLREKFPNISYCFGSFDEERLVGADLIAVSPGIDLMEPILIKARELGIPIHGDIEIFAQNTDLLEGVKLIGITGSNGKSTVTEMVTSICKENDMQTVMAGNIGLPVLDFLTDLQNGLKPKPDVIVIELSSFQIDFTESLRLHTSALLNISEDHLDRYGSLETYRESKLKIFDLCCGVKIFNRDDLNTFPNNLSGSKFWSFGLSKPDSKREFGLSDVSGLSWISSGVEEFARVSELRLLGAHNVQNALAAAAICKALNVASRSFASGLAKFHGLPHRLQPVGKKGDVSFVNDSKATNVAATVAALNGMNASSPVVILGGETKGQNFLPLKDAIRKNVSGVILLGDDIECFEEMLKGLSVPYKRATSMANAVLLAYEMAMPKGVVLLSPACSSLDRYQNYQERGKDFFQEVKIVKIENE